MAGGVAVEHLITISRVAEARVVKECLITVGRVAAISGVVKERECSGGRVGGAGPVPKERSGATGRISVCGVGKESPAPIAVLKLVVLLLLSERKPTPVL